MLKKTLPIALGIIVGLYAVVQYYIPHHTVGGITNEMRDWAAILAAAAYLLGAINLIQVTLPKIRRREADWQFKVVMLASAAIMLTVGFRFWGGLTSSPPGKIDATRTDSVAAQLGKAVIEFDAPSNALVQVGANSPVEAIDVFGRKARIQVDPGPLSFKVFREMSGYEVYDQDTYKKQYASSKSAETKPLKGELAGLAGKEDLESRKRVEELKAQIATIETPPALVAGQVVSITSDPPLKWGNEGRVFVWVYDHIFAPCNATMFALLAFFVASAAFRAFRARNIESALLLGSAIIIMIGNMPMGRWLWDSFPDISQWILEVPNNGSRRAIIMGAAVGAIATSLRVVLGLERSHLGSD